MRVFSTGASYRSRASDALWAAAVALLAAMPLGMAIAQRSSPVFVTAAAVCALGALALDRSVAELAAAGLRAGATPLGLAAAAFLAWAAASVAWSEVPLVSLRSFGEVLLCGSATLVLALLLPARAPRAALPLAAAGMALGCAVILAELGTGLQLREALGARSGPYIFNRSVATLVVVLAPVAWGLSRLGGPAGMWGGATLVAAVAVTVAAAESGAAVLGLVIFGAVVVVARLVPRATVAVTGVAIVVAVAVAPVVGEIANRAVPPTVHSMLAGGHPQDRIDIWRSFGASVRAEPVAGEGFGSSPKLDAARAARNLAPEFRSFLAAGHPHNAALQVWVELGVVGASLAALVLLLLLRHIAGLPPPTFPPSLAAFAAICAVSLVGHGAWQGWWAAAIGSAVVWFRIAARQEHAR